MKTVVAIIAVGLVGVASSAVLKRKPISLPEYIVPCRIDQPDFNSCILSSIQKFIPHLATENEELQLPSFEPYLEDEIAFKMKDGLLNIGLVLNDVKTYGLTEMNILAVRTDFSDDKVKKIEVDIRIPQIKTHGKFRVSGTLMGGEFDKSGDFEISLSNVTATSEIYGALVTIGDLQYMKVKKLELAPEIQDADLRTSELFKNIPGMTEIILTEFKRNWKQMPDKYLLPIREKWNLILQNTANSIFLRVPFNQIFPSS